METEKQVWSTFSSNGRPDQCVFTGTLEECKEYVKMRNNEYPYFDDADFFCIADKEEDMYYDKEGFLQWKTGEQKLVMS